MSAFVAFATFCGYCLLAKVFYDEVLRKPKITYCDEDTPIDCSHCFDKERAIEEESRLQIEAAHECCDFEDYATTILDVEDSYWICKLSSVGQRVNISLVRSRLTYMTTFGDPASQISEGNLPRLKSAITNKVPFEAYLWNYDTSILGVCTYYIRVYFPAGTPMC